MTYTRFLLYGLRIYGLFGYLVNFWVVPISLSLVQFLDIRTNSGQFRLYGQLLAGPNGRGPYIRNRVYLCKERNQHTLCTYANNSPLCTIFSDLEMCHHLSFCLSITFRKEMEVSAELFIKRLRERSNKHQQFINACY